MSRLKLLLLLVMSLGLWQVAAAATNTGTLLVGFAPPPICGSLPPPLNYAFFGYSANGSVGSYSPTGLTGGETVYAILDSNPVCFGTTDTISITGFSSNPGGSWLISVTCGGVTKMGSIATYAYYGNGTALWSWRSEFGFMNKLGSNVSCSISHH